MTSVKYSDLFDAYLFVSAGAPSEANAYVDRDTGAIYWVSDLVDLDEAVPDDLETSDRFIAVPHKYDLDLGRDLALAFAARALADQYDTVADFFRGRGAYRRFKDFLHARGLLEQWYAFEGAETEAALRAWCSDEGIELQDGGTAT
jgi:hypothetical protein